MPQPNPYNRQFNFADYQVTSPTAPLPGQQVDAEYNAVKLTLDQILTNLVKIQRDDGALKNGIVTQDSLSGSLSIGFTYRGVWAAGQNYALSDGVSVGSLFYRARVANFSTIGNAPGTDPATWELIADITPLGIAPNSIYTAALQNGVLSADATGRAKMGANFFSADATGLSKFQDGLFTADATGRAKIADGFLTTAKIADSALSADATGRAKMANKFVTLAKLDDIETSVILGRKTAATGGVEKLTPTDARSVLAQDSVLLQTVVLAGSLATVDFTSLTGYSRFIIEFEDIAPATDDTPLIVRMNDGSTWLSASSSYSFGGATDGPAASANLGSSTDSVTTSICLSRPGATHGVGNAAGETCSGEIAFDVGSSTTKAKLRSRITYFRQDGLLFGATVAGARTAAGTIAGIRLMFGSGNFQNIGRIRLRGVL